MLRAGFVTADLRRSDGRIPKVSRNELLKWEELLKPIEYAMSVIEVRACSGCVIIS